MPALLVDMSDRPAPVTLPDSADLVYFLSFAYATRYGSQHELSRAALRLRGGPYKIDLRPLTTFADRDAEDEADRRDLERAWQDAAPLAETCRRVVAALDSGDETLSGLTAEFPALRGQLARLGEVAAEAAARAARIRLTFAL